LPSVAVFPRLGCSIAQLLHGAIVVKPKISASTNMASWVTCGSLHTLVILLICPHAITPDVLTGVQLTQRLSTAWGTSSWLPGSAAPLRSQASVPGTLWSAPDDRISHMQHTCSMGLSSVACAREWAALLSTGSAGVALTTRLRVRMQPWRETGPLVGPSDPSVSTSHSMTPACGQVDPVCEAIS
jgi:hypothetical protein